jgi:hypothetical protein
MNLHFVAMKTSRTPARLVLPLAMLLLAPAPSPAQTIITIASDTSATGRFSIPSNGTLAFDVTTGATYTFDNLADSSTGVLTTGNAGSVFRTIIAQGQLHFYLLPYPSCKARSEVQLVYECKIKFVINDIAVLSQGLAKRH